MRVSEAMAPAIATVTSHTPLEDVADLMRSLHCDVLLVEDDGAFAGLVTASDVLLALVAPPMADGPRASQMMRGAPIHDKAMISPDATVDDAVRTMADLHVDHLAVVNGDHVVGLLRLADVAPGLLGPGASIRIRTVRVTMGLRSRITALWARVSAWLADRRHAGRRAAA